MPLRSVADAMREFKSRGGLHSGKGGPRVTNRKQAIAIGMDAKRRLRRDNPRTMRRS